MGNFHPPKSEPRSATCRLPPLLAVSLIISLLLPLRLAFYYFDFHFNLHALDRSSPSRLEIRLVGPAVRNEGIGAVLAGLKPVLLLANYTGAVITMRDKSSGHGYSLRRYLNFLVPLGGSRVICDQLADPIHVLLDRIANECDRFNSSVLSDLGVFNECNTLLVDRYLSHPRPCIAYSAPLIRAATKFNIDPHAEKTDVCLMRRGGDVEDRIRAGEGNMWALDEPRTKPIMEAVKAAGAKIVVVTETKREDEVRNVYDPDVLSNKEDLDKVVAHLQKCRCTFIAAASSFAAAMMQVTMPEHIIYTESRDGFEYETQPYPYGEYGDRAIPLGRGTDAIVELCASR